jgi:hypothetical protein
MAKRQPDSKAVAASRVELAAIVEDFKGIKTRARAIARRLKAAARTAEPAGDLDGEPWTEEAWLADYLRSTILDDSLDEIIDCVRALARGARRTTVAGEVAARADRAARRAARQGIAGQAAV